ncbi:dipeptidase [Neobacillus mesonae]|uniref:dipeptidase n=1 Tax=Neobacillus mesonae TaxID=1193713 RepID=UPI00203ED97D|nr:membrane dipeptidase [Neobacillus mesonae]MCM3568105.1 membrane dipeptidase [Neobacillus mesonae]
MKVFDLHSDLFTDIAWRTSLGEKNVFDRIHYPKLKEGGIQSIICVFWVEPKYRCQPYDRFQNLLKNVMGDLIHSKHAAISHPSLAQNEENTEKINIYLGLEGLTFMEGWEGETTEKKIEGAFNVLHNNKIMHSIFAWNEHNFLATGTGADHSTQPRGLTTCGRMAVQKANEKNWILDVSHLDETSFWDIYNSSENPIIASHSNAKAVCDHERNLTDRQIKAIAKKGGIIGLNSYGAFVDLENPTVEKFIDHAIYVAELVGTEHLAFGFDFVDYLESYDLGSTFNTVTKGLEDASKIPHLLERMSKRGFTNKELEAISFHNAQHFIKKMKNLAKTI